MEKLIALFSKKNVFAIAILFAVSFYVSGQPDSLKLLKNTIRINATNPMLFGPDFILLGYERVITKHQTASIGLGKIGFASFLGFDFDSIGITNQKKDKGYNFSFDYRFYLKNENKYGAPRGVYLGPYYAFNRFSRDITWELNTAGYSGEANTSFMVTANLVGAQMGYQFILWNRVSIDIILMGPGLWFFNLKSKFNTTLPFEDETLLLEKLNEMLKNKFPGSDLIIKGGSFEAKKNTSTASMGFRYLINLGIRF